MSSNYKPTGFPRGRPRKGEIRPLTPGGINSAKWRAKNHELYCERQKLYYAAFKERHPVRVKEIEFNYRQRKKLWGRTSIEVKSSGMIYVRCDDSMNINVQVD